MNLDFVVFSKLCGSHFPVKIITQCKQMSLMSVIVEVIRFSICPALVMPDFPCNPPKAPGVQREALTCQHLAYRCHDAAEQSSVVF